MSVGPGRRRRSSSAGPGRKAASAAIRFYQLTVSSVAGRTCRHLPTCSDYAAEAVLRHGVWPGAWMGAARICRCGPFGTRGLDFVPAETPPGAAWHRPWRYGRWRGTNPEPPDADALRASRPAPRCPGRGRSPP